MYLINFLVAIFLPYISLFSKLAPPDTVPTYFFSDEAAFVAGEFNAIVFYWAGFLRNSVAKRTLTERQYFGLATAILIFMCASKIIFTLPYTWITSIFAFGLGVLSVPSGQQNIGKWLRVLMVVISVFIFIFSAYILLGMAWFGFQPIDYYYYKNLLINIIWGSEGI